MNLLVTLENEIDIKNKIAKHVTSYTKMIDGTGFPVNPHNKKSMDFFLAHRCHSRHKFRKIDKKLNDKIGKKSLKCIKSGNYFIFKL